MRRQSRATVYFIVCLMYASALPDELEKAESGYVTTADGVRLFYKKAGTGRETVIVPYGYTLFRDFKVLAKNCTMIFYDMRDRGHSDEVKDAAKITIQKDVDDLETIRQHFGAGKVSLIGESYLGMMVVLYATQHPEHVNRIVQIAPVSRRFGSKYPAPYMASDDDRVPDPDALKRLKELEKNGYANAHPKEFCEQDWKVERTGLVGDPANGAKAGEGYCDLPNEWPTHLEKHFAASIASIQNLEIGDAELARVTMPVLTIHGTKDRNAPYGGGREWAATLQDARLMTVKDAAHFPWLDDPRLVFSSISTFLGGSWPAAAVKVSPGSDSP